jgi:DNA-binding PadR family transcriptional regulator
MEYLSIYRFDISIGYRPDSPNFKDRGEALMQSRRNSLELAILGLLIPGALHGYELRKRIIAIVGPFRALSFSVIYPQLHRMMQDGLIVASVADGALRRSKISYALTEKGSSRFTSLTEDVTPEMWEDESFEIHFAFFGPTPVKNRVRILEGRHRRLRDKAEILRGELEKSRAGLDKYLEEWRRHSLDSVEREILWLEKMITTEGK